MKKKIRPLTEADDCGIGFFMQRRQVLKALGISASPYPYLNGAATSQLV